MRILGIYRIIRYTKRNVCQRCGKTKERNGRNMDVHHKMKFKSFEYVPGVNRNDIEANVLDNLISLCLTCHPIVENHPETLYDFRDDTGDYND